MGGGLQRLTGHTIRLAADLNSTVSTFFIFILRGSSRQRPRPRSIAIRQPIGPFLMAIRANSSRAVSNGPQDNAKSNWSVQVSNPNASTFAQCKPLAIIAAQRFTALSTTHTLVMLETLSAQEFCVLTSSILSPHRPYGPQGALYVV